MQNLLRGGVKLFPISFTLKSCTVSFMLFIIKAPPRFHSPTSPKKKKKKEVHLLITDTEPICVERVS